MGRSSPCWRFRRLCIRRNSAPPCGAVTDTSGPAIAGATVTITNKQTGSTRTEKSGGDGRYLFGNAQPGTYDVKVEATGFRTVSQTDVSVTANTVSRVELKLEVGQVTETINVESAAILLQTDKADTHSEIDSKSVTTLPLPSYRNYQSLINEALRTFMQQKQESLEATLRRVIRDELRRTG